MKICQAYFGNVLLFFWKKKKEKSLFWKMSTFAFVLFCLKKKKKIHQGNFERWRLGWLYAIRPINFLYSNLKKHKQSLAQFCRLFKLHTQPTTANGYFSSLFSFLSFFLPLAASSLSSSPVFVSGFVCKRVTWKARRVFFRVLAFCLFLNL